jgi:hypothetical protein
MARKSPDPARPWSQHRSRDDARRAVRARLPVLAPVIPLHPPRTRGECIHGPRPCPWLRCRYHLAVDVREHDGEMVVVAPHAEHLERLPATCALDVAELGALDVVEVGACLDLARERVRQIERDALAKVGPELAAIARQRDAEARDETPEPWTWGTRLPDKFHARRATDVDTWDDETAP